MTVGRSPGALLPPGYQDYADPERSRHFATGWGSELVDLGPAGHINPAAGFGPWPRGEALHERLRRGAGPPGGA